MSNRVIPSRLVIPVLKVDHQLPGKIRINPDVPLRMRDTSKGQNAQASFGTLVLNGSGSGFGYCLPQSLCSLVLHWLLLHN